MTWVFQLRPGDVIRLSSGEIGMVVTADAPLICLMTDVEDNVCVVREHLVERIAEASTVPYLIKLWHKHKTDEETRLFNNIVQALVDQAPKQA
jgi:hypothetical protein